MTVVKKDAGNRVTKMTSNSPKPGTCAYCGKPSQGNYAIHRDGFGEGPEVDVCDACGGHPWKPTCEEIWSRISECGVGGAVVNCGRTHSGPRCGGE